MVFPFRPESATLACVAVLAFAVGCLAGLAHAFAFGTASHPPTVFHQSGSAVAAVSVEAFRDGALRGTAVGPVRLFFRDEAVAVGPDGTFAAVVPAFRVEEVSVVVPEGMLFVASKKGKKYHPVDSAAGERIVPENRVYFRDSASAEAAGFTP